MYEKRGKRNEKEGFVTVYSVESGIDGNADCGMGGQFFRCGLWVKH